ncbi:33837_t:CDS:2, partial [Gigaspora margarita]
MNKLSNFLPSNDQLVALAKECVPKNTVKNTEGWIKIINQWQSDINYKEPLENQDKETIELQVSQFLLLYLEKPSKKDDQGGIEGNQSDLIIPFPSNPEGISGPNSDLRKYLSFQSKGFKCLDFYLAVCCNQNALNVELMLSQEILVIILVEEQALWNDLILEYLKIPVMQSADINLLVYYYAYAKPTNKYKRKALANILYKLINTTPSNEMAQDLTINTILSNEIAQDSIEQINPESNNNEESQSIRSEDDELSDADLNNLVQV